MRGLRQRHSINKSKSGVGHVVLLAFIFLLFTWTVDLFDNTLGPSYVMVESANDRGVIDSNLGRLIPENLTLAVATLVLNQGRYLKEWIDFHVLMGFQFFLIFDDGSTDDTFDVLAPYVQAHTVVIVHARPSFEMCSDRVRHTKKEHQQNDCQKTVFNYARSQLSSRSAWMANFDVDEFVWTPKGPGQLPLMLMDPSLSGYDRLDIMGLVFGTSNVSRPSPRPVLETYTHRVRPNLEDLHGPGFARKALFRPGRVRFVTVHDSWCIPFHSLEIRPLSPVLRLNHYQYKSRAEQHEKAFLNGNPGLHVNSEVEAAMNEVEDRDILDLLVQATPPVLGGGHSPAVP